MVVSDAREMVSCGITEPLALNDEQLQEHRNPSRDELDGLQGRAEYVAAYLGFESFESLADWVNQGDALRSRLGFMQSTPRALPSSSSTKKGQKSSAPRERNDGTSENAPSLNDSPLIEKGNGRIVVTKSLSSRCVAPGTKYASLLVNAFP